MRGDIDDPAGDDRPDGGEPFGRWLRRRVAWLALVAGVALLAWAIVRPCDGTACTERDDLFILLPALPLVFIGGVTLLGEWAIERRERSADKDA
ncbi:MAG TPA: hypothetical protein VFY23_07890 [Candidatus Limnocylindrales bacterium]|nr:hypothetical protein [Candidatus Limnocylindrales bacterium]